MKTTDDHKPVILLTGCSSLIGTSLIKALSNEFRVAGLDVKPPDATVPECGWTECDMTDDQSVASAMHWVRSQFGDHIASVIHLAAYYDFSGEPSPLYRELTVEGTRRLLRQLQQFQIEQLVFSSTLLVMKPSDGDDPVDASSPIEAEWDYPLSKLAAEKVIQEESGAVPAVILRIAGVYDEDCHSLPIAQQISRIYQKRLESYLFPGDKDCGQAFIHLNDLVECFQRVIQCRKDLVEHEVFVIGEEDVMSYAELQEELGQLIHGKQWPTIRIPKFAAKAGAWVKDQIAVSNEDAPFIKPWMIDLADQNYPVNIQRARSTLRWEPKHTLRKTLPEMIGRLHRDPKQWYETNDLPVREQIEEHETAGASRS